MDKTLLYYTILLAFQAEIYSNNSSVKDNTLVNQRERAISLGLMTLPSYDVIYLHNGLSDYYV